MWTVSFLLHLAVFNSVLSSSPPGPTNVVFSSVNLRNVLQWTAGNGTSRERHFTVQYAIYGDTIQGSKGKRVNWRDVPHCTDIPRSWCDLSNETRDEEQGYHARVRVVGRKEWVVTHRRFDPKLDTTLGPPLVSVEMEGSEAVIHMKGPLRYQPDDYVPATSMTAVYPRMTYNLSTLIHGQTYHLAVDANPYRYPLREHNTKYCFSVRARLHFMPVQCQSSDWHCITTPQDPETVHLLKVIVGIVVPTLCLCVLAVVVYFLHSYLMGEGQKSHMLNSTSFYPSPLTFAPENLNLNLILVSIIPDESRPDRDTTTADFAWHNKNKAGLSLEYSPEGHVNPREPDVSPVEYGFVGVETETANGRRFDRGEDGDDMNGVHKQRIAGESYEGKDGGRKDGNSFNVDQAQSNSYMSQQATNAVTQSRSTINSQAHEQVEISKLVKAQPWSQGESEVKGGEDKENSGLFLNTSVFTVPSYRRQNTQLGVGEEMNREVRARPNESTDEAAEGGSEDETVALLSAYASQNIRGLPPDHVGQTDLLQNNYGLLSVASEQGMENNDDEEEEEEEEGLRIVWDAETRRLVFPGISREAGMEEREGGSGGRVGGVEGDAASGGLKLENVFVKQASEEEEEIQGEMEGAGGAEWEADDILSKWNLIVSMDQ